MSTTLNAGAIIPKSKGLWVSGTSYSVLNIVTYEGKVYISLKNANTSQLTDTNAWGEITGPKGDKGDQGEQGNGISSIVLNQDYTLIINFTNGTSTTTASIRGEKGETGETGAAGPQGATGATGPQGPKGDTVILGDGENYTLYNTTGSNTDGAMTQAAVTAELTELGESLGGLDKYDDNSFAWSSADGGVSSTSILTPSLDKANGSFTVTGKTNNSNPRTAYLKLPTMVDGNVYRIKFDYQVLTSSNRTIVVGLGTTTSNRNLTFFTIPANSNGSFSFEREITYLPTYGNYLTLYYNQVTKDNYITFTNVSVEHKIVASSRLNILENKDITLQNEIDIINSLLRMTGIESFSLSKATVGTTSNDYLRATKNENTGEFTFLNPNTNATARTGNISLPSSLVDGQTYQVEFDYTALTASNRNIKVGVGSTSISQNLLTVPYGTDGTFHCKANFVHSSSNTSLLIYFLHTTEGNFITLRNISIKIKGTPQEISDSITGKIDDNYEEFQNLTDEMEKYMGLSYDRSLNWYTYGGARMMPQRACIERLTATGNGYPQGFSIYADYAMGFKRDMPGMMVFNVKEKRYIGTFGGFGTVLGRHANSQEFTDVYFSENDAFPMLYVSGGEKGDGGNFIGIDYLIRVTYDGITFGTQMKQTITVTGPDGTPLYHNTLYDHVTGHLWIRTSGKLYEMEMPELFDGTGNIISTATLNIDNALRTITFNNLSNPQGGCIHKNVIYLAYGLDNTDNYIQAIDLLSGTEINHILLSAIGYGEMEPEDLAFWGNHMITSGGGASALYEIHWE